MSKRIAVIGSGISGLVSAYLLNQRYAVTLFEASDYLGGYTHTHDLHFNDEQYAVDTGFSVFNKINFPNFSKIIEKLDIPIQKSEMSFSFRSEKMGIEYSDSNFNALFSDRRNLFKPAFYRMINDISRFNKATKTLLLSATKEKSIEEFIVENRFQRWFTEGYLLPKIAAIWPAKPKEIFENSSAFTLNFLQSHGLLDIAQRPQWYIIAGGAKNYIQPLTKAFDQNIHLNTKVNQIRKQNGKIILQMNTDEAEFDAVIVATSSTQALQMLAEPSADELRILSAIPYQKNEVVLHYDNSLLPRKRKTWAGLNYTEVNSELTGLTRYMNKLQNISAPVDFCVSLNQAGAIHPEKIIKRINYFHPCFTKDALLAQQQQHLINGKDGIYFCGPYWKYGSQEDGVNSALEVCQAFAVEL